MAVNSMERWKRIREEEEENYAYILTCVYVIVTVLTRKNRA